jgi:hypothetical protein
VGGARHLTNNSQCSLVEESYHCDCFRNCFSNG